jgi:hypothetical protein
MSLFAPQPDADKTKAAGKGKEAEPVKLTERERDAGRKRESRAKGKTVEIPVLTPVQRRRRTRLEKDDAAWLRWYFHTIFWYPFTEQQLVMIATIGKKIRESGDKAIAASRGEGKSTLAECLGLKYVLEGVVSFLLLLHSTGSKAEDSLDEIKQAIESNERLAEDYPEVCIPVQALEQTPNRAHYQLVSGKRDDNKKLFEATSSKFSWCGQQVFFPNVPGSPSAGAIVATRGLDAEVRGVKKMGRRPDLIIIDDPDTEQTVNSEEQAIKLEKRIDRGLAFAGGQQKAVARVMLTTIQRRDCPSAKYTDPTKKPSWQGQRFRFLVKKPDRSDFWDEYVSMRVEDQIGGDEHARRAHQFYLDNRDAMDAGAVVANKNRFNPQKLPDGSQIEVSALQRYYNEVARVGQEAVSTEYDNDPPEESGPQESGLTAFRVQRQVSGFARKIIPPGCTLLTQGIDCGKVILHYVVRAWKVDEANNLITGYTIDYGIQDVYGTTIGSDEGLDEALLRALIARREAMVLANYETEAGEIREIDLTLVDAGYRTEAVYDACRQLGMAWKPYMGFGKSNGCVKTSFTAPVKPTADKKTGDHWFLSRQPRGTWLVCGDADFWKSWEHDRWLTDPNRNGSLVLFGTAGDGKRLSDDQKRHLAYSKHITAEIEVEELVKGVLKRYFKNKSDSNHYLDASYMTDVAASMKGIRLVKGRQPVQAIDAAEWFGGK